MSIINFISTRGVVWIMNFISTRGVVWIMNYISTRGVVSIMYNISTRGVVQNKTITNVCTCDTKFQTKVPVCL